MDDRRFDREPDLDLEDLLADSLSAPPEEDILREITPWRQAMNRVLTGLALTTVHLNFLWLDFLLPTIGYLQLLLGLRVLRRENGFFKTWWAINLVRSGWWFFSLLQNAVPGTQSAFSLPQALVYVNLILQFLQLFCLWLGLRAVQRKAGLPPEAGGPGLIIWQLIVLGLAYTGYSGWLLGLPMLISYFCILYLLYGISKDLDEAGYAVRPAPVRLTDRALVRSITAVLIVGLAVCMLFLNRFPMDWQPVDPAEHSQVSQLESELLALGFPEEVLADLARSDILACGGAVRVVSGVELEEPDRAYDVSPVTVTHAAVELTQGQWRIFHHFSLPERRSGTYAIQLWPANQRPHHGWARSSEVTGRVLYDRDGTVCQSPYYFLGSQTFTADTILWGEQTSTDIFASFSLPRGGEGYRGYVTYETAPADQEVHGPDVHYIIDSWFNFVQPTGFIQYPVRSAQEWRMAGHGNWQAQPFYVSQSALQFAPELVDQEGIW